VKGKDSCSEGRAASWGRTCCSERKRRQGEERKREREREREGRKRLKSDVATAERETEEAEREESVEGSARESKVNWKGTLRYAVVKERNSGDGREIRREKENGSSATARIGWSRIRATIATRVDKRRVTANNFRKLRWSALK